MNNFYFVVLFRRERNKQNAKMIMTYCNLPVKKETNAFLLYQEGKQN